MENYNRFIKNNNLKTNRGMSLSEVLIALVVLGLLVVMLLPSFKNAQPNNIEVLHNKGTHMIEFILNDIKTDPNLYPNSDLRNTKEVKFEGKKYEGDTKFCELFASRLNLKQDSEVNCTANEKTLTTVDGIDWYLPVTDFKNENNVIKIDVNGDKNPNCVNSNTCPAPDQFEYQVKKN